MSEHIPLGQSEATDGDTLFSKQTVITAEGARVGFVTCEDCGAAILLDPREDFDPIKRHRAWHRRHDD